MRKLIINDIPEGYDYAAVNPDGEAFAYKGEPTITVDKWVGEESCYIGHDFYNTKWKDSLLYRFPNRKLTVEDIPEGYSYAVICNDGSAYCSKRKPIISSHLGWNLPFYEYRKIDGYFDASDWKNSLVCKDKKSLTGSNYRTIEENNAIVNNQTSAHYQHQQPTINMKLRTLTIDDIPKGYYWAAVEPDGVAYAYKEMPYLSDDYNTWEPEEGSDYIKLEKKFDASNWKRSLITSHKNCKVFFENPTSDDIPEGYNYIAVSRYGRIYAFIQKPLIKEDYWKKTGNEPFRSVGIHLGEFDWKNSLVSRQLDKKILTVEDIPQGYNYAAVDFNSWAYAYVNKPSLDKYGEFWKVYDNRGKLSSLCLGSDYDTTDYKNSLVSKTKKPVLKKLTVDDIPEGYYYAASDSSGTSWAYQSKPKKLDHTWIVEDDSDYVLIGSFDPTDWQNSLVSKEEIVRNGILSKEVDCLKTNTISSFDYSKFNSVSFFDYGKINSNPFPPDNTKTTYNQMGGFITGISNSSNKTSSFDFTFIKVAEVIAERSKSTRLKVGAVLVKDNRIISTGYNGLVSGVQPDVLEDENGVTKKEVIHAELNCIISCARNGVSCEGSTLYLTHSPCQSCAALIAQSGIKKVIFKNDYRDSIGINKLGKYGVKVIKLN